MSRLAAAAACLLCGACGNRGDLALDSTRGVEALTRGEAQITYYRLPPGDVDASNDVYIPTLPGKDVEYVEYYPPQPGQTQGPKKRELRTRRSDVVETILSNIEGIDSQKFLEDERWRQFGLDLARMVIDAVASGQLGALSSQPSAALASPASP